MGSWTALPARYFLHDLVTGGTPHNGSRSLLLWNHTIPALIQLHLIIITIKGLFIVGVLFFLWSWFLCLRSLAWESLFTHFHFYYHQILFEGLYTTPVLYGMLVKALLKCWSSVSTISEYLLELRDCFSIEIYIFLFDFIFVFLIPYTVI